MESKDTRKKPSNTTSHRELCDIGVRWLKRHSNGIGCQFAVSEIQTSYGSGEQADVFGYRCVGERSGSWLVEVKTSRSDFLADFKKPHRQDPTQGVGQFRVYMCPEGVIKEDELPEGWGLVYVNSRGHVKPVVLDGLKQFDERNQDGEAYLMARLISRFEDVEKFNNMLKEASAMSSRAWAQVDRQKKEIEDLRKTRNDQKWFIQFLLSKIDREEDEMLVELQQYKQDSIRGIKERLYG